MALRIAFVLAIFFPFWSIYRSLPGDGPNSRPNWSNRNTSLTIETVVPGELQADMKGLQVKLSPVDLDALEREFNARSKPGVKFDDFLNKYLNGRKQVNASLNESGVVTLTLPQGRWWLYAATDGPVSTEWKLPLNVTGPRQRIVLSGSNVYSRSQKF